MTDSSLTAAAAARRALARFELAAIRQRNVTRVHLGVSDEELTTLLHLLEHEQLTQRQLFAFSTLSRSGVGAMVNRLEDAGLIERLPDLHDKRVRVIQLSARGARRMREARGACDEQLERLLADRPEEELQTLADLLSVVAKVTQSHSGASNGDLEPTPPSAKRDWRRWG